MGSTSNTFSSSIGRKLLMSLSALFLVFFLLQHFAINLLSVCSADAFNQASHFMGTNPMVQFVLQPILISGVILHFVLGFILEAKNRSSRPVKYYKNNGAANSTWMSRNMIYSGLVILAFLILHFLDFWIPELNYKYIEHLPSDVTRYHSEVVHEFANPIRVVAYVVSFFLLSLHLLHGFQSAFQSIGINNKYTPAIQTLAKVYSIAIPFGFIFIAIFHFLNQH